ncbi:MAG TPA: enoyl-CoA hydratase/isomerase family protein [Jatrophihabitantaceae bacterium]|jgi:enoyl-CoA hydratase/carnithine racemase
MSLHSDLEIRPHGDHVVEVEIRRGPHNYFSPSSLRALAEALEQLDQDPDCRAVVLCSEGRNFCAGADFGGEMAEPDAAGRLYEQAKRLFSIRTPIVAALQGAAIGGGLGLALAADFRVGTTATKFTANFSRLGFHHGFGLSVTLPAVVGSTRAADLLMSSRSVGGDEAFGIGLLDQLAPENELRAAAGDYARRFVSAAPLAVRSIKETLRAGIRGQLDAVLDRELCEQTRLRSTSDFGEGVRAANERRAPVFRGA